MKVLPETKVRFRGSVCRNEVDSKMLKRGSTEKVAPQTSDAQRFINEYSDPKGFLPTLWETYKNSRSRQPRPESRQCGNREGEIRKGVRETIPCSSMGGGESFFMKKKSGTSRALRMEKLVVWEKAEGWGGEIQDNGWSKPSGEF